MTEENTRILKLFYAIIGSSGFVKAGELAGLLQTSERTVKSSMEELKTFACQKGCQIQSVRGKGYRLQVTDAALFEAYKRRLEILFNNVEKKRRGKQNYDVARAIILGTGADREGYIRLEDLAQELFMSDSALKKEMAEVRGFFSSFQLSLISRPGRGVRLTGKEFNLRLCMLELYENHYKTRVFPFRNEAYEKTVADRGDQEEIRRMALGLIRGSRCEFLDIYINRLVDYFLLLRNRRGKLEFEPENEADGLKEELSRGPEYDLARQLAVGLEKFEGYKSDEEEIRGIGRLILLWADRDWEKGQIRERFPAVFNAALECLTEIRRELEEQWKIPFDQMKVDLEELLLPELTRILIQNHFGFCGCQMIGSSIQDNEINSSPLSMTFADCAASIIGKYCGVHPNAYNVQLMAVRFFGMIQSVPYQYRSRRLLVCGRNGKASGRLIADEIRRRMGTWWLEKMDVVTLYEARKFPREAYDCVIGSFHAYAYNYEWPYIKVSQAVEEKDIREIYGRVLLWGYDLEEAAYEKKWDVLRIHRNFSGYGLESFFQLLAFQWGKDYEAKTKLNELLGQNEKSAYIHRAGQILYILAPVDFTGKQILELYMLKKPLSWQVTQIRQAVFASMDFAAAPRLLKFMEQGLRLLPGGLEEEDCFSKEENVLDILTDIVRRKI